jgi:hypothetical protein
MKHKTKKYIPNKHEHKLFENKFTLKKSNQPKYLYKLLSDISSANGKITDKIIVLRPGRGTYNTKIINYIDGVEDVLQMKILKDKFKKFFTLDYMNYVNLDIDKRRSEISRTSLKYEKQPIIFEGYLAIIISSGFLFDAYMLDRLKIITPKHKQGYGDKQEALYFPQALPDIFVKDFETPARMLSKIYEIINQAYTIIKYIAIILAHQKLFAGGSGNMNAFEIIKVQMRGYDDLSLILDGCKVKKDWQDTLEDRKMLDWLNTIFFKQVITNGIPKEIKKQSKTPDGIEGIARLSLYKRDLMAKYKREEILPIYASKMKRSDFNNKFIIILADYIVKDFNEVDFHFSEMMRYLKKYGLEFEEFYSTVGTKPAFIFFAYDEPINYQLTTQHYNTLAYCANTLDSIDNINNKSNLFFYLKKLYPNNYTNFIADSFLLSPTTKYTPGKIYIARPVYEINPNTGKKKIIAFSGRDIIYITNPETLAAAKRLIGKYDNVLISDYISNPLLFKGRKFHLRVYLIITYINSVVKTHFFSDSYIWTAAKPFVLDKFDDKAIHDTHYKSTDDDYLFSSDFNTENMGRDITTEMKTKLQEDMQSIMDKVSKVLQYGDTGVKIYNNHKNGFQIEGIDIMINDKMQPILIECNNKPGFSYRTNKGAELQKRLFAFIDKHALQPIFGANS